jgi:hypothetical protein
VKVYSVGVGDILTDGMSTSRHPDRLSRGCYTPRSVRPAAIVRTALLGIRVAGENREGAINLLG